MADPSQSMAIRDIMTMDVVSTAPDATILEVAKSMSRMDIGSIIIVDRERAIGLITEADILRRVVAKERNIRTTRAREIMSSPIIHVEPQTPLTQAMRIMAQSRIRRLAVLKNHSLVGIVTSRDILRWSPELIDILIESLKIKEGEHVSGEQEEEDRLIAYGGSCDMCGGYSTELTLVDGQYVCEDCRR